MRRRGEASRWSSGAGTTGNAPTRTCSSQVFHVKHWYIARELQLPVSCIRTSRITPMKSASVMTSDIQTTRVDGSSRRCPRWSPWCWNHKKWAQQDVATGVSRETVGTPREVFHVKHSCTAAQLQLNVGLVRWTAAAY